MKTRSQKYSEIVFKTVQEYTEGTDETEKKKYKSLCKRSGGLLRTVGLIQYLTYLAARGADEQHYKTLLEHLRNGLQRNYNNENDFLAKVRNQDSFEYMQITEDVLGLLQWHKRIADVLIEGNCEEGDE